jgi:hypothetical protein
MSTPELSFATPTNLIAALPHLLGFIPVNDIVALMLGPTDHQTEAPLRAAIRCPATLDLIDAQRFPSACRLSAAQFPSALLVAVCEPQQDDHALRTLHTIRTALRRNAITVLRMFTTHTVTEPDRWTDPDTGHSGPTVPYTDSPATALGIVEGRVIAPSRADMAREFATTEAAPQPDLGAQDLSALIGRTATDLQRAIVENSSPDTDLAVRAAVVVTTHTALRDGFLRLGAGHELGAGRMWTSIAAHHRGRIRAELLTMAAVAYYCGEDTVRTGMALTYAAAATRDDNSTLPQLAAIIHSALQAGMPPTSIRSVIPDREATPIPGTQL